MRGWRLGGRGEGEGEPPPGMRGFGGWDPTLQIHSQLSLIEELGEPSLRGGGQEARGCELLLGQPVHFILLMVPILVLDSYKTWCLSPCRLSLERMCPV